MPRPPLVPTLLLLRNTSCWITAASVALALARNRPDTLFCTMSFTTCVPLTFGAITMPAPVISAWLVSPCTVNPSIVTSLAVT